MRALLNRWILPLYSGAVTAALLVLALHGSHGRSGSDAKFESIDVQRIRLVEPDGTVRMIIADNARMPGLIIHGKEHPHEARKAQGAAGMVFFDAEGTESGGLIFGGKRDGNGKLVRFGHLSFDQYGQDEMFSLSAAQEDGEKRTGIQFKDQPDWPLEELVKLMDQHKNDSPEQRKQIAADFMRTHDPMHVQRVWLGRNTDRSSSLELKDDQGRPRLVARVAADGTPTLTFLDANGNVTAHWPDEEAGRGKAN
jgi:hypothetical protein